MATVTYNPATKQFLLPYTYTDAKGKEKTASPKPRGIVSLTNQIIKAQSRGVALILASITSQDITGQPAGLTIAGPPNNYAVTIVGFGAQISTHATAADALREVIRLTKEYPDKVFKKAMRKRQISISLLANPAGQGENPNNQ